MSAVLVRRGDFARLDDMPPGHYYCWRLFPSSWAWLVGRRFEGLVSPSSDRLLVPPRALTKVLIGSVGLGAGLSEIHLLEFIRSVR